jgi:hypothetical protein
MACACRLHICSSSLAVRGASRQPAGGCMRGHLAAGETRYTAEKLLACGVLKMNTGWVQIDRPNQQYWKTKPYNALNRFKQVVRFTLCCRRRLNPPISRPFRRISSAVAMSIVSITSFTCTVAYLCDNGGGRRRYVRCVDFWRVLMF